MEDAQLTNMLVILIGPSGVGKTTIMNELKYRYKWKVVPTFHTRKKRLGETEKISIEQEEFDKLVKLDFFFSIQDVFNYCYGQPLFYIEQAFKSETEYWIFDITIKKINDFIGTRAKIFYILPSFSEQLHLQLIESKREYKIQEALADYAFNYRKENLNENIPVIENAPGKLDETIKKILNHL